ncbi:hypothetical protein BSK59_29455 [Paenibacillus odorifer]|uniref:GNAT family N-acetyltransferase n=1 Tax=Paenibacillus odorifer TaxID=189426 RepID=UPI00096D0B67|nr:GNAT family N-acetyltransferase [Paenibacillus odorifer]OME46539.1 hypothetical protein BSK59_29455 [Paenibacillus odorifer]
MKRLECKDYYKAIEPLENVKINTMFAESVVKQVIAGSVYVDDIVNPRAFYIAHPCGMSLLIGESDNEEFKRDLFDYITNKNMIRHHQELLQADPAGGWPEVIAHWSEQEMLHRNTRVNFSFNRERYLNQKASYLNQDLEVVRMNKERFMAATGGVNPKDFWRNEEQFLAEGLGFNILDAGEIASTAFSGFVNEHQLEIGIETSEAHRGKGYAYAVCSALIEYCLEYQLEPVWACRLDNEGSFNLAHRLGFETTYMIPYYRLVESVIRKG